MSELKLPRTTIEKRTQGWCMETLTDAWTISTRRMPGGWITSAARAHNGIELMRDDAGAVNGYNVQSDCDCEVIQLGNVKARCTRSTIERKHAEAWCKLKSIMHQREQAGIDRAEAAAERAECRRQGATA